ncbi:MAG: murein L,D-transpeptidase family protein [Verrucomicrobiota bacterium JB023]|nr:murein L,D-transpeptidase family protein [Verrucomicrobiota bacterium JB023]
MPSESSSDSNDRAAAVRSRIEGALRASLTEKGLEWGAPVFIRIVKEERELELWLKDGERFKLFRKYPIAGMSGQLGPKLAEGDRQAPEGFYYVPPSMMHPRSRYHLAFNLGYPNAYDRARGRTGSFIMVHGSRFSVGCFAMTDAKIEEIYTLCDAALEGGQPFFRVHVFPFHMTEARMKAVGQHRWKDFWFNLEEGYRWFEEKGTPPDVIVRGGRYAFQD